jgi:hypothetical protein
VSSKKIYRKRETPILDELRLMREQLNIKNTDTNIARRIENPQIRGLDNFDTIKTDLSRLDSYKNDTPKVKKIYHAIKFEFAKELAIVGKAGYSFDMLDKHIYYIYYYYSFTEKQVKPAIFAIKLINEEWSDGKLYYLTYDKKLKTFKNRSAYTLQLIANKNKFIYYKATSDLDDRMSLFIINLRRTRKDERYCLFGTYNGIVSFNEDIAQSAGKFILIREGNVAAKINKIAKTMSVEPWIDNKLLFATRTVLTEDEGKGYKDENELDEKVVEFNQYKCSLTIFGYYVGYYLRKDIHANEGGIVRILMEVQESSKAIIHYREYQNDPKRNFPKHSRYKGFLYFPLKTDNSIIKGEFEAGENFGLTSRILAFLKPKEGMEEIEGILVGKKRLDDGNLFSSPIVFKKIGNIGQHSLKFYFNEVQPSRIPRSELPDTVLWGNDNIQLEQLRKRLSDLSDEYFEKIEESM